MPPPRSASKFRKSARLQDCAAIIPGICNRNPETVVLCHAPHTEKGMGKKGPDTWAAFCCSACHDFLDLRDNRSLRATPEARKAYWLDAIMRTQNVWRHMDYLPRD